MAKKGKKGVRDVLLDILWTNVVFCHVPADTVVYFLGFSTEPRNLKEKAVLIS